MIRESSHQRTDARKMIIVMFAIEIGDIDNTHGLLQPGMLRRALPIRFAERLEFGDESSAFGSKIGQKVCNFAPIVVGFVRPSIRRVGGHQDSLARQNLFYSFVR